MEMRKCDVCGEEYSTTYRSCPFCQEKEALERGKPIRRHSSDFRNRRGGHALGVLALVLSLVLIGTGAVYFFGENIAMALGMRQPDTDGSGDGQGTPISSDDNGTKPDTDPNEPAADPNGENGQSVIPPVVDPEPQQPSEEKPSTAVSLSSNDFTINGAGSLQNTLKASGGSGKYTWSSADPAVATVSESGVVTGVSNGTTEVTVTDGYTSAVCVVRVKGVTSSTPQPSGSTTLSLNRTDMTMPVGSSWQLKVKGTTSAVSWSVEDPTVASIDSDGTLHFLKRGTTNAIAKVDGQTLVCIVRVNK